MTLKQKLLSESEPNTYVQNIDTAYDEAIAADIKYDFLRDNQPLAPDTTYKLKNPKDKNSELVATGRPFTRDVDFIASQLVRLKSKDGLSYDQKLQANDIKLLDFSQNIIKELSMYKTYESKMKFLMKEYGANLVSASIMANRLQMMDNPDRK